MPPKAKKDDKAKSVDKKGKADDKKPEKKGNDKGEDAEKSRLD